MPEQPYQDPYNAKIGPRPSTLREKLSMALQSLGVGTQGAERMSNAASWLPGGQALDFEEAYRNDDLLGGALAALPGGVAAKAGKVAREARPIGRFAEFAEHYPPVPEPMLKTDKKTGKQFIGKGEDKVNKDFMAERLMIQKDMDENGYEPMFPPSERFDVDKSNYPSNLTTLTDVVAAKPDTIARHEAVSMSPESMQRLEGAYLRGREIPDADRWYWMGQLEQAFMDDLGPEAGREAFRQKFAGAMAATTGGMDPMNNLMAAQYGNYLQTHGLPYPQKSYEIPSPLAGPYVAGNVGMHEKFAGQGFEMGEQNPKRYNFMHNFLGHEDKATIDEQMSDLIKPGMGMPPAGNYGSYEKPVHVLADKYGVSPREMQEVMWAGGKQLKNEAKGKVASNHEAGKPMIQFVNDAIERTHRLTGMPRNEILRRALIRGEIPLYGLGAAAGTAGLTAAMYPQDDPYAQ